VVGEWHAGFARGPGDRRQVLRRARSRGELLLDPLRQGLPTDAVRLLVESRVGHDGGELALAQRVVHHRHESHLTGAADELHRGGHGRGIGELDPQMNQVPNPQAGKVAQARREVGGGGWFAQTQLVPGEAERGVGGGDSGRGEPVVERPGGDGERHPDSRAGLRQLLDGVAVQIDRAGHQQDAAAEGGRAS